MASKEEIKTAKDCLGKRLEFEIGKGREREREKGERLTSAR